LHNIELWPDLEDRCGDPYVYVHRKEVLSVLVKEALQLGADLGLDSQIVKIDLTNGSIFTARGAHFRADVIIGADGENSFCRSLLNSSHQLQSTGKLVQRFVVEPDTVHADPQVQAAYHSLLVGPEVSCNCIRNLL
jgi:salicylate hydroxylase